MATPKILYSILIYAYMYVVSYNRILYKLSAKTATKTLQHITNPVQKNFTCCKITYHIIIILFIVCGPYSFCKLKKQWKLKPSRVV